MLAESVTLLRLLWSEERVTWTGAFRSPLRDVTVHPRPVQRPYPPVWLSASSPESVDRAVALGCPIVIPTVSVGVEAPPALIARYREGWRRAGRDPRSGRAALHVHCYLSWVLSDVAGAAGPLPPHFAALATPEAQAVCGSVDGVAADLERRIRAAGGVDLLLVQIGSGRPPARCGGGDGHALRH